MKVLAVAELAVRVLMTLACIFCAGWGLLWWLQDNRAWPVSLLVLVIFGPASYAGVVSCLRSWRELTSHD